MANSENRKLFLWNIQLRVIYGIQSNLPKIRIKFNALLLHIKKSQNIHTSHSNSYMYML